MLADSAGARSGGWTRPLIAALGVRVVARSWYSEEGFGNLFKGKTWKDSKGTGLCPPKLKR